MGDKSWTDREQFELFVSRTQQLYDRRIWKEGGISFKIALDNEGSSFEQPDEELLRSYMMSFRLFVQEKEPTYFMRIRNLAGQHLKPELEKEHIRLKNYKLRWQHVLDKGDLWVGTVGGDPLKPKDVLDAFLNGEYFHSDKGHRVSLDGYLSDNMPVERMLLLDTIASLTSLIMELGNFIGYGLKNDWFNLPQNNASES